MYVTVVKTSLSSDNIRSDHVLVLLLTISYDAKEEEDVLVVATVSLKLRFQAKREEEGQCGFDTGKLQRTTRRTTSIDRAAQVLVEASRKLPVCNQVLAETGLGRNKQSS